MGCPHHKADDLLPLFNLVVIGEPSTGKSTLIRQLSTSSNQKKIRTSMKQSGSTCVSLQSTSHDLQPQDSIPTFAMGDKMRVIAFQAPGKCSKNWPLYFPTCNILLYIVNPMAYSLSTFTHTLSEIDRLASPSCQIIVIFTKQAHEGKAQIQIIQTISRMKRRVDTWRWGDSGVGQLIDRITTFTQE